MTSTHARRRLTPSQVGMWFGEQWERSGREDAPTLPGARSASAVYHINPSLRMRGPVDTGALHQALRALLDRHPILRSRVVADREPSLEDAGPVVLAMPIVEFQNSPHTAEEMAAARLAQEVTRSFDLSRGPLVRTALLRLADDHHVVVLVVHHLVCDGLSMRVLYRDLGLLYQNLSGGDVDVPEASSWYAQPAVRDSSRRERVVEYWKGKLLDAPLVIELPSDRPRPDIISSEGAALQYPIPPALWQRLLVACATWRVTPYMALVSAYAVLLSRVTGQRELIVGSPSSGRWNADEAEIVGMFVTTLPLRITISETITGQELLDQVRITALEAMQFGTVSLEELIDELRVPRSTAYSPIVQTMCSVEQLDVEMPTMGSEVRVERITTPCTASKFELSLGVEVTTDGVITDWEFRRDLFDVSTVAVIGRSYLTLLASLVDDADSPVLRLPMHNHACCLIGPSEVPRSLLATGVLVPLRIATQAGETPDAIAVRSGSTELTYGRLDLLARVLADRLRAMGAGTEDTVLLALPRGVPWAVGVLGTWYSGASIVPLDLSTPNQRLRAMVQQTGARFAVGESAVAGAALGEQWGVDLEWLDLAGIEQSEPSLAEPGTISGSLAYILFTSGSNGKPKPVAIGHDALAHYASIIAERFRLTPGDVILQFAALTFDVAFEETLPVWCIGGSVLFLDDNAIAPADLEDVLREGGGTVVNLPSSYWAEWGRDLDKRPRKLPTSLRLVVIGSETSYLADLERWRTHTDIDVMNAYGQTETTITSLTHLTSEKDEIGGGGIVPIGSPMRSVRAYVLDSAMQPVSAGLVGELYLAGPCLGRGYYRMPAATAQRFLPDPFASEPGSRMYRTGDRVRLGPDNALRFLGRTDDQVKVRGHRVELSEIEIAVASHPEVGEVVARAARTDGSFEIITYVVPKPEYPDFDVAGLRRFLVDRVPSYQVPAHLLVLPELPRTAGGKLDPSRLPLPPRTAQPPSGGGGDQTTRENGPEATLLRIWSEVLGQNHVSIDDNFFTLGGDSILSIRVVSLARTAGIPVTVRDIFRHQTVRNLAVAVRDLCGSRAPASDPAPSQRSTMTSGFHLPATDHVELNGATRTALLAQALDAAEVHAAGPLQRWGLAQLAHHARPGLYRVYEAFDLSGTDVDVDHLLLAWNALIEHHPTLRTSLRVHNGRELQVVHRNAGLRVHREDLRGASTTVAAQAFSKYLDTVKSRPAEPAERCQVELAVFDLGPGAAYFAWNFSYLILDGWSFPLLFQDLLALHDGFRAGRPVQLPCRTDPGVIARWWQDTDHAAARAFWVDRLAGAPECLVAPALGPGEGGPGHVDQRTWLSADRTAELTQQAAHTGLTLHTMVQGAYAVVLGHALNTEDMVFGTAVSGRTDAVSGAEEIVGCLNNRLPSRVRVESTSTCRDWLRQLQDNHAEASAFEHVSPLEIQRWCGVPDHQRLYDSEIVVENFPFDARLQSRMSGWNQIASGARSDETLRLTVWPDPSLLLKASYYQDAINDARVVEILHQVKLVLTEMAQGLYRPVNDLINVVRRSFTTHERSTHR